MSIIAIPPANLRPYLEDPPDSIPDPIPPDKLPPPSNPPAPYDPPNTRNQLITFAEILQEIRYLVEKDLTPADVPYQMIIARAVLVYANRYVLSVVGTPDTDEKREICEESVIRLSAAELVPSIAEEIAETVGPLTTRYAEIDWEAHRNLLLDSVTDLLRPHRKSGSDLDGDYIYAISRDKAEVN